VWASDGQQGFLLDLIEHPDEAELRLDLYGAMASPPNSTTRTITSPRNNVGFPLPTVHKQFVKLSDFSHQGQRVKMGPLALDASKGLVSGTVNGIPVHFAWTPTGRDMDFVPGWAEKAALGLIPNFHAYYGNTASGVQVNSRSLASGLPSVYATYPVRMGLTIVQWVLISATSFAGAGDLQIQVVGTILAPDLILATSYVYVNGTQYKNDGALFALENRVTSPGTVVGGDRVFAARIHTLELGEASVTCQAPTGQFALLAKEGATEIHTTVMGSCTAVVNGKSYASAGSTSLLELKAKAA
jgi:hypothetical protein